MIPKTFSATSAEDTYAPSIEDTVRDAVWLMLYSDEVNRRAYSYDDDNPDAGVRIFAGLAHIDPSDGRIVVPQQIVSVATSQGQWSYEPNSSGVKRVAIAIGHLESPDTKWLTVDVDAPQFTPETRVAHTAEIIMRGTLYAEGRTSEAGRIVDPYLSPLNEDETYDLDQIRLLSNKAPEIKQVAPVPVRRRPAKNSDDLFIADPVRDVAILYSLVVVYTVDVTNRENMRAGGYANG